MYMILFWNKIIIRHFHDHNVTTNPPNTTGGNTMAGIPPNVRQPALAPTVRESPFPMSGVGRLRCPAPLILDVVLCCQIRAALLETRSITSHFPRGSLTVESHSFEHASLFVESCIEGLRYSSLCESDVETMLEG
jgi:hypothetical protein